MHKTICLRVFSISLWICDLYHLFLAFALSDHTLCQEAVETELLVSSRQWSHTVLER